MAAMKVLDLQCAHGHAFEGWFASEDDFVSQCARSLVQCPACGNAEISKKLSAPRLNLGAEEPVPAASTELVPASPEQQALTAAWMEIARRIVAHTDDVGERFATEARRMHYGDAEERAIRGKTTPEEARALVEEGIEVMPFLLPEALKNPLQ